MSHSDVIVQAVLARQEFVAIRTVQTDEFLLKYLVPLHPRLRLRSFLLLLRLLQMIAFDVTVQIVFHFEQAAAVRAFEHVRLVECLVNGAHVIPQRVQTCERLEAQLALGNTVNCTANIKINICAVIIIAIDSISASTSSHTLAVLPFASLLSASVVPPRTRCHYCSYRTPLASSSLRSLPECLALEVPRDSHPGSCRCFPASQDSRQVRL